MSERIHPIQNPEPKKPNLLQPILFAIVLVVGVYIGSNLGGESMFVHRAEPTNNPNKLVNIIQKIDQMYVDSIEKGELIDDAIRSILENLDPHSYYISPEEMAALQEPLEGNFEGIGVEFMILKDTLTVVTPIEGGPSEEAGILAGDRIVAVNGENIAGIGLTNDRVMKLLKGEKGTDVALMIKRRRAAEPIEFNITRERIPIYSVVAALNLNDDLGYVKVTRFAKNTYDEFVEAVDELRSKGASKLILDLRGNGGGYLNTAIPMVEEFLDRNQLIVYTEGVHSPRKDYFNRRQGRYRDMELVVLINQGSASASEIMAGALQDHDRAITVGRRSFGKGLVQDEIPLPDESALRLTVARYYTPTGRSIQRPYGGDVDYSDDYNSRYENGELYSADSVKVVDSLKYLTPGGRMVYGGGGIMPDIFVPLDTAGASFYLNELAYGGVFRSFAFDYLNQNKKQFDKYKNVDSFLSEFSVSEKMINEMVQFAQGEGIPKNEKSLNHSIYPIKIRLMAQLARNMWGEDAYYRMILEDDNIFSEARRVIDNYNRYMVSNGVLTLPEEQAISQ
jgi:carboxyl-terminal processing protease